MKKYSIRLDLTKIDKTKIKDKEFTTKDGNVVKQKIYDMDFVFLKDPKVVKTTDKYQMVKNAFLSDPSVKGADGKYINGQIIGDSFEFRDVDSNVVEPQGYNGEVSDTSGIDF